MCVHPWRQQGMAQGRGSLPCTSETQIEFWTPGVGLAWLQLLQASREGASRMKCVLRLSLYMPFKPKNTKQDFSTVPGHHFKQCNHIQKRKHHSTDVRVTFVYSGRAETEQVHYCFVPLSWAHIMPGDSNFPQNKKTAKYRFGNYSLILQSRKLKQIGKHGNIESTNNQDWLILETMERKWDLNRKTYAPEVKQNT